MEKFNDDLMMDAELDLWQEDIAAEEAPAVRALFCVSTFGSVSSVGPCVATAGSAGTLSCPG